MRREAIRLPALGTGPHQRVVVSHWYAARGAEVLEGDRLVEILVGPATFDVPAPFRGRLAEILKREDDLVSPGDVLGVLAVARDD
jgi:pyruvate/2-oxoglutarate dehydrogenase complex dihydrolipoamide acyltransferase (E2) component